MIGELIGREVIPLELTDDHYYHLDTCFSPLAPGEAIVVQVQTTVDCPFAFSTLRYTKLVVDSLDAFRRAVYFHSVHNPNCGYRSLVPGEVPRN